MKKNCFYTGNHAVVASTMCKMVAATMVLLLLAAGLQAQDTLYSSQPPASYHVGVNWPQFEYGANYGYSGLDYGTISEWAMSCITDTQLTVYGLAAILGTERTFPDLRGYIDEIDDLSVRIYEYLRLYEYNHNYGLRQIGEDLMYQEEVTPVAYYLNTGLQNSIGITIPIFPVFEFYYNKPVTVHDTFYIGHTNLFGETVRHVSEDGTEVIDITQATTSMCKVMFNPVHKDLYGIDTIIWIPVNYVVKPRVPSGSLAPSDWDIRGFGSIEQYYYLFPILTPPDSNAVEQEPDTVSIGSGALADRYTEIFPNPAQGSTRVVSSFGLARVEAFTLDGRKVQELKPTGYAADIDVSAWPAGEYVLRIATRQGTVTRRLTVAR